ncbi:hypothetical protein RU07_12250 [Agrobacterium tumefaciens]|uniref:Uncharacterized protein n=1 Tax=Agrobacterium tumefaciens TaxID=358 RepID=A0A0D0KR41_AGRTU|nr:hypothetical protein RU07_12250 [Agrobacterium tumefaciens]
MQERTHDELRLIGKMADEMLRLGEGCTDDDLMSRFTRLQVRTFKEEARDLANQRAHGEAA